MAQTTQPQVLGRYLVADPDICHGKPTFRGTRILVADVLEQVAAGSRMGNDHRRMAREHHPGGHCRSRAFSTPSVAGAYRGICCRTNSRVNILDENIIDSQR